MTDKRIVGEKNELDVLEYISRFGWLTTRMVGVLIWPEARQGDAMARRTLKRMQSSAKLLAKWQGPKARYAVYTLTAKGARRLAELRGVKTKPAPKPTLATAVHRAASNWFLIGKLQMGFAIWTEHEIQTGKAPWGIAYGKTADGAYETEFGTVLVEVENAWKSSACRDTLSRFAEALFADPDQYAPLAANRFCCRLVIVSTNLSALRAMIRTFDDSLAKGFLSERQLHSIDLALLPVSDTLTRGDAIEGNLWWDGLSID